MKKITVNVDDLGLAPAVNTAVLHLAEMGRIHAASFMSLGQMGAGEAAALQNLGVDIGLHLDLTALAAQGCLKTVMLRSWLRRWDNNTLSALIARQLDAFEDQIGRAPVFVDGHQHVHQFPQVREQLLAEILRRYGDRMLLRHTRPLVWDLKSQLIYFLGGPALAQLARSQKLASNRVFGGVYAFNDTLDALQRRWQRWLAAAPAAGTVLMCHPAMPDDGWKDDIRAARSLEWQWLSSDAFANLWRQHDCRAQSWADLAAAAA